MSRVPVADLTKGASASGSVDVKELETRADRKARIAEVYSRGIISDRLNVTVPEGRHPQWVRDDEAEINRLKTLGFELDTTSAPERGLHDKGDGVTRIGDTVLMTCSAETKEIIDELRRERYDALHASKSNKQKEERDFTGSVSSEDGAIVGSKVNRSNLRDISDAVNAAVNQAKS